MRGGMERDRDRIPSSLRAVSEKPNAGLELTNHEIMTRTEIKSWTQTEPPQAPPHSDLIIKTL